MIEQNSDDVEKVLREAYWKGIEDHHRWKIDMDARILFLAYAQTIDGTFINVSWENLAEETQEAWRLVAQKAYELYN